MKKGHVAELIIDSILLLIVDKEYQNKGIGKSLLEECEPVIEYLDGWKEDISNIRKWEDLPKNAKVYVEYIEKCINCHIKYVSVGQERNAYIER